MSNRNNQNLSLLALAAGLGAAAIVLNRTLRRMIINDLESKTVLITGGSRGLGLALAAAYIHRGANVVICGRDTAALEAAQASIRSSRGTITGIICDVTREDEVDSMLQQVMEIYGRLDVVINNAASRAPGAAAGTEIQEHQTNLETNYFGMHNVTTAALPALKRTPASRIVNISSTSVKLPSAGHASYSASKAAQASYSESLRQELAGQGIAVTTVYIGYPLDQQPPAATWTDTAEQVLAASQTGQIELTIPRGRQALHLMHTAAPNLFHRIADLTRWLLPRKQQRHPAPHTKVLN